MKTKLLTREFQLPIEILANLIYLTKRHSKDADSVARYMGLAEQQLQEIIRIASVCKTTTDNIDADASID